MTDDSKFYGTPGCRSHRSARLRWRDYDALPTRAKRAFQNAHVDWCVRCFTRDGPAYLIPSEIARADEIALLDSPYV